MRCSRQIFLEVTLFCASGNEDCRRSLRLLRSCYLLKPPLLRARTIISPNLNFGSISRGRARNIQCFARRRLRQKFIKTAARVNDVPSLRTRLVRRVLPNERSVRRSRRLHVHRFARMLRDKTKVAAARILRFELLISTAEIRP